MAVVETLSAGEFRGIIGVAQHDITPPSGIYSRCWGAATSDVAEGVHRPLTLTTLTFEQNSRGGSSPDEPSPNESSPLVLISADLMSWRSRASEAAVIGAIRKQASIPSERFMFCLSHTHAAPSVRSEDADKTGGHLIAPYQQQIVQTALRSIQDARATGVPATITWRYGRCDLATHRDLPKPGAQRIVCGFNPSTAADDTLLVGRVCDDDGKIIATIVNYACHPTTLAWENKLISPDWIGAMRETIQSATRAPCLFLQGASGELAPAQQYVADPEIADRHGRRVGFAALSVLEAMLAPATTLAYGGIVESGAPLALWKPRKVNVATQIKAQLRQIELPLKELPSLERISQQLQSCRDPVLKQRLERQRAVRAIVGNGTSATVPVWVWKIGDAILVGQPTEAYSMFQIELRRQFAARSVAVMNLVNGSIGYLAPQERYAQEIYQVWQSPFAQGSLEILLAAAKDMVSDILS